MAQRNPGYRTAARSGFVTTRRRLLSRAAVGSAGLSTLWLLACSGSNNKNTTARTATATVAASATSAGATPGAPGAATAAATRAGTAAPAASAAASAAAAASATKGPSGADLAKLSDNDFFKSLPANPPKDWADADIKPGGRFVMLSQFASGFDFISQTGGERTNSMPIYSQLIRFTCRQGLPNVVQPVIEGDLATKWEKPDLQTIVFTLAPNIKWQNVDPLNGRALKADDIKYTIDRGKNYSKSQYKTNFALVDSVEDAGNGQVRFKLSHPDPLADQELCQTAFYIVPPEQGDNQDAMNTKPIGTGGFVLKNLNPNVEAVYDKNPDFFKTDAQGRKKPYLDGFSYQYYKDPTTAQNIFITGQGDWGAVSPPLAGDIFSTIRDVQRQLPNLTIQFHPRPYAPFGIGGKWEVDYWKDVRFRRALSMVLPRQKIADSIYKGFVCFGPYYPWPFLFDTVPPLSQMGPNWQYDPKTAKQLIDAAGLGGKSFDMEYIVLQNSDETVYSAFKDEAAAIGVTINLVKVADVPTIFTHQAQHSWKDLISASRGIDFIDPWASARAFVAGQSLNVEHTDDAAFNDLFTKLQTAQGDERKQIGKQMWDRQLDQVYEVSIPVGYNLYAWQPRIKNYVNCSWSAFSFGEGSFDGVWVDPNAKPK